ncbi:hypothetical protein FPV67DRAFT_1647841 [Lyophyllum atratum]|nr:hypothetical protein FPV67DRAFT_1647841 [Lyophyllum atratum]
MSDDEFGGLAITTPAARVKRPTAPRATKPNSRTEAGPSKPKGGRKNAPIPVSDHSEAEESAAANTFDFTNQDDDEDDEHIATPLQPARTGRKPQAMRPEPPIANGKSNGKGKDKAKSAQPKRSQKRGAPAPVGVDPIEVVDEPDDGQGVAAELAEAINTAGRHKRINPVAARSEKDFLRMEDQLRRAQDQIKTLSSQLEEVFQVRETEAEQLLKLQEINYEHQLQAQQNLIGELRSQLAMQEPLMRTGDVTVLNLLTREAADEEKRVVQKEVSRWRDLANEKQRAIEERDEKITQLEQAEQQLRLELEAEIKRSTALANKPNRNPPSVVRGAGRPGGVEDPRHAEVLRFYEDLSNLLVPHMKSQPGKYLNLEDWILSCIYTFSDDDASDQANTAKKSLNFTLKCCYETPEGHGSAPITHKDQLIPTVHFTPLELDKESAEFVQKLEFLGSPFSFERNQLPLFLRTIYSRMGAAVLGNDEDSVEMIEGDSIP